MTQTLPDQDRAEALAFLAHFTGDIAQPLHASGYLRGSNEMHVKFGKQTTNLHAVWDSKLLEKTLQLKFGKSRESYVTNLLKTRLEVLLGNSTEMGTQCAATVASMPMAEACAAQWAEDSNRLVCSVVYPPFFQPGMDTSGEYYENAKSTVDAQLLKGGLRLGTLLNRILE
jgi:hypothetical protein